MKTLFVDSNAYLRFVLKDNLNYWNKINSLFILARKRTILLVFLTEIIIEIEYVLRKFYKMPKKEIHQHMNLLISISYIDIKNRDILKKCFQTYLKYNIDLVDLVLFYSAKQQKAEVLSFDKDFKKLS